MRLCVNNTFRGIHCHYTVGTSSKSVKTFFMKPGLNQVPDDVLLLLLAQSGFKKLLDKGLLSKSKGDVSAARDIQSSVDKSEGSTFAPKPVAPSNTKHGGLKLSPTQTAAVANSDTEQD